MTEKKSLFSFFYAALLSEKTKKRAEIFFVSLAIISFLLHLVIIALIDFDLLFVKDHAKLFIDPITAIYTPFSFILIYEVYLLVYYLPKSITTYVGKQYEIITLIVIRRLFKDLSNLELTADWFQQKEDLQFTYDLVSTLILSFMIFVF